MTYLRHHVDSHVEPEPLFTYWNRSDTKYANKLATHIHSLRSEFDCAHKIHQIQNVHAWKNCVCKHVLLYLWQPPTRKFDVYLRGRSRYAFMECRKHLQYKKQREFGTKFNKSEIEIWPKRDSGNAKWWPALVAGTPRRFQSPQKSSPSGRLCFSPRSDLSESLPTSFGTPIWANRSASDPFQNKLPLKTKSMY